jgi:hypothetical protein
MPYGYFMPHIALILDKDTAIINTKQANGTLIIVNFKSSYVNVNAFIL